MNPPWPIPTTIVLARHFPPSVGGIQTFTEQLLRRLEPEHLLVVAPSHPRAAAYDMALPFEVVRRPAATLVLDARRLARARHCAAGWLPAALPYGLAAAGLRRAGVQRLVASTHGQESAWMGSPPTRAALRAVSEAVDVLTYLGPWAASRLRPAVSESCALQWLAGGVDSDIFRMAARPPAGPPTSVTLSRLVPRKGHAALLKAWPRVLAQLPLARLVIVGDGPTRAQLENQRNRLGLRDRVHFTGRLTHAAALAQLHAAHVFVAPCRDRWGGLLTEGLGLSALEAAAAGLPVVVGRSGGSIDTVLDGHTGVVVDAGDIEQLSGQLVGLLADPTLARTMGRAGHDWVREHWRWDTAAARLAEFLGGSNAQLPKMV
jgi:glycosyltransferase involved in cell wall biosynthesis